MNIVGGGGNQVRPDGTFQLTNVPPGEYVLDVQQRPQNIRSLQDINLSQLEFASMPAQRVGRRHRQSHHRHHSGRDGVRTRGLSGTGRAEDPVDAGDRRAALRRAVADRHAAQREGARRRTSRSGRHVRASRHRRDLRCIRVQGVPAGWALKSITVDGTDITDACVRLQARQQRDRPGRDAHRSTDRDHRRRARRPRASR